jgi:hypothetical protein
VAKETELQRVSLKAMQDQKVARQWPTGWDKVNLPITDKNPALQAAITAATDDFKLRAFCKSAHACSLQNIPHTKKSNLCLSSCTPGEQIWQVVGQQTLPLAHRYQLCVG